MSLSELVAIVGGDLVAPDRALVPGPGHSPGDRSVSLYVDRNDRLVVTSFGRSQWREVLDDLRARNLIDANNRLCTAQSGAGPMARVRSDSERIAAAIRLWDRGGPVAGTLSERYVRNRAIRRSLPGRDALRHLAATPLYAYADEGPCFPALLAAIRDVTGAVTAVEITYLNGRGARREGVRTPRKIVGVFRPGGAVRLDPSGADMAVAEGVFTALSVSERFGRPTWAALSIYRLESWRPPEGVRSLLVAADNGRCGARAARRLIASLAKTPIEVRLEFPSPGFDDFNTQAQQQPFKL